jgi:hypothetical protein
VIKEWVSQAALFEYVEPTDSGVVPPLVAMASCSANITACSGTDYSIGGSYPNVDPVTEAAGNCKASRLSVRFTPGTYKMLMWFGSHKLPACGSGGYNVGQWQYRLLPGACWLGHRLASCTTCCVAADFGT